MTSLTRELNNHDSHIYRWFQSKHSSCAERLLLLHNKEMSRKEIIKPSGKIKDFGLLGTAFVYAFRWHLGLLDHSFDQTVASYNLNSNLEKQLLSAKTDEDKAIACLMFAAYEVQWRCGNLHEIASVLMNRDKSQLKPELNYVLAMIDDLTNLIISLPTVWNTENNSLTKKDYHLNATFAGGHSVSADAQQIINGSLIKCFTTLKKSPLSKIHLWQQIAYVLMDWDDTYQIDQVIWYYSRQKALFSYPIKLLFKDLQVLRFDFKDMILKNYGTVELFDSIGLLNPFFL